MGVENVDKCCKKCFSLIIAVSFIFCSDTFRVQFIDIIYQSLLARCEGLPRHSPVLVLEVEASPGQDEMYVQAPGMLSAHGQDTSFESAFAQAAMLALNMSDCPLLLEV